MLSSVKLEVVQPTLRQQTYIKEERSYLILKRCFDLLMASFVILFVLSWLIPILGLLIILESRGPMLFIQLRTGLNGRSFRCFKFRTMTYERNATFKQAVRNDHRITRIGGFLRRTNLDEMPQFVNVLLGDMSIVGPRPHAVQHDADYWTLLTEYHKRYEVRPGITGLAQVRGARGGTDQQVKMKHRLRYDLFYIKKRTLRQDLLICWWTLKLTLKGDKNAW